MIVEAFTAEASMFSGERRLGSGLPSSFHDRPALDMIDRRKQCEDVMCHRISKLAPAVKQRRPDPNGLVIDRRNDSGP